MTPNSHIFYYYLCSSLFLLFNYLIGHIIFWSISIKRSNSGFMDILSKTLTGMIVNVILFSLIITKGISYNLAAIPIILFLYFYIKNNTNLILQKRTRINDFSHFSLLELVALSGVFLFIMVLHIINYINLDADFLIGGGNDNTYLFYTRIADYLLITGEENLNTAANLIDENYNGSSIYHYFELWLGALHNFLFGSLLSFSFKLSIHSLFLILMYCAYCILLEHFVGKLKFYHYLLVLPFIFSSSIYSNLFLALNDKLPNYSIFHFIYGNEAVAFLRHKVAIVELIILTSIILFLKKRVQIVFCFLLYFSLSYSIIAPAALSSIFIFSFFSLFAKEKPQFLPIQTLILCIVIPSIILIITKFNAPSIDIIINHKSIFERIYPMRILTFLGVFATQQPLLYLPFSFFFIILFIYFRKRINGYLRLSIYFFLLLFICGSLFGSLLDDFNWRQFYNGISYPLSKIVFTFGCFTAAISIIENRRKYNIFLITFSVVILLSTSWLFFRTIRNLQLAIHSPTHNNSIEFLEKIDTVFNYTSINEPTIGIFLLERNSFEERCKINSGSSSHTNMINMGTLLSEIKNTNDFFNLSWRDINLEQNNYLVKSYVNNSVFSRFIEQQKTENTFTSIEESKTDFVNKYNIRYLIMEKDVVIPQSLKNKIEKTIVDKKTGLQFCILTK